MNDCPHKTVTIYYREVACATYYEPAEYEEIAECDECGARLDPSDVADAEVSDTQQVDKYFHGWEPDRLEER